MCNWQSPNACLVWMFPVPGAISNAPSTTFHFGAFPSAPCHADMSFPSKRIVASDGAAPGVAPGVTAVGTGRFTSLGSHLSFCEKAVEAHSEIAKTNARTLPVIIIISLRFPRCCCAKPELNETPTAAAIAPTIAPGRELSKQECRNRGESEWQLEESRMACMKNDVRDLRG